MLSGKGLIATKVKHRVIVIKVKHRVIVIKVKDRIIVLKVKHRIAVVKVKHRVIAIKVRHRVIDIKVKNRGQDSTRSILWSIHRLKQISEHYETTAQYLDVSSPHKSKSRSKRCLTRGYSLTVATANTSW
ncbi:hypothetical protein ElyMa_006981300 [Elysia marginata]|uniref:Uncharacterized protein n=1 Tax=Elysia marginata TaxID=1093978 RepID=A0AAV4JPZ7_9GAST|nr:hypothetical protein ElyMa_006981300 [Elysia marginata]